MEKLPHEIFIVSTNMQLTNCSVQVLFLMNSKFVLIRVLCSLIMRE